MSKGTEVIGVTRIRLQHTIDNEYILYFKTKNGSEAGINLEENLFGSIVKDIILSWAKEQLEELEVVANDI